MFFLIYETNCTSFSERGKNRTLKFLRLIFFSHFRLFNIREKIFQYGKNEELESDIKFLITFLHCFESVNN